MSTALLEGESLPSLRTKRRSVNLRWSSLLFTTTVVLSERVALPGSECNCAPSARPSKFSRVSSRLEGISARKTALSWFFQEAFTLTFFCTLFEFTSAKYAPVFATKRRNFNNPLPTQWKGAPIPILSHLQMGCKICLARIVNLERN